MLFCLWIKQKKLSKLRGCIPNIHPHFPNLPLGLLINYFLQCPALGQTVAGITVLRPRAYVTCCFLLYVYIELTGWSAILAVHYKHCTLYTVHCKHCTLYTVHCKHCTLAGLWMPPNLLRPQVSYWYLSWANGRGLSFGCSNHNLFWYNTVSKRKSRQNIWDSWVFNTL